MPQMMDALVKTGPHPGLELERVPVPQPGHGEVLNQNTENGDLRNRRTYLQLGQLE